jgi:CRP-like cAMP-binding protein
MSEDPPEGLLDELGSLTLFAGLNRRQLRNVVKLGEAVGFPPGERIVGEGDHEAEFYLILAGRVEMRKGGMPPLELGRGEFFGGATLLQGKLYQADMVALEPTRCFVLSPWSFKGLLRLHPDLLARIDAELARRTKGGPGPSA